MKDKYMNVTINIPDILLSQADYNAQRLQLNRSEYIRQALDQMNQQILKNERYTKLQYLSKLTREESIKINFEFDAL